MAVFLSCLLRCLFYLAFIVAVLAESALYRDFNNASSEQLRTHFVHDINMHLNECSPSSTVKWTQLPFQDGIVSAVGLLAYCVVSTMQ